MFDFLFSFVVVFGVDVRLCSFEERFPMLFLHLLEMSCFYFPSHFLFSLKSELWWKRRTIAIQLFGFKQIQKNPNSKGPFSSAKRMNLGIVKKWQDNNRYAIRLQGNPQPVSNLMAPHPRSRSKAWTRARNGKKRSTGGESYSMEMSVRREGRSIMKLFILQVKWALTI